MSYGVRIRKYEIHRVLENIQNGMQIFNPAVNCRLTYS